MAGRYINRVQYIVTLTKNSKGVTFFGLLYPPKVTFCEGKALMVYSSQKVSRGLS
jgi:hypothetical protein